MRTTTRTVAIGFALILTACADVSNPDDLEEGRAVMADGDDGVAQNEQALLNPNLIATPIATPIDPGSISLDPGGVVPGPGGTKKTPCEKATNQFYRAQAAYFAAADALRACGLGFEPQCAAQAAAFEVANQNLNTAYATFLAQCP